MGHLLILQDEHKPKALAVQRRAHSVFRAIFNLEPLAEAAGAGTLLSVFGTAAGQPARIVSLGDDASGACGMGAWTLEGEGPENAVRTAGEQILRPNSTNRPVPDALDGSFVIAAWDLGSGEVKVVTDRIGTVHCYYADLAGTLVVCTSSMVLAALLDAEWDTTGVAEFLSTGTIFDDRTLFRGVRKIRPSSILTIRGGEIKARPRYWNLADVAFDRSTTRGTASELADALEGALRTIVRTFGTPCLDLTGGYDSRVVLAAMLRCDTEFGTVVNGTEGHPDVTVADRIAHRLGLSHRHQSLPGDWGAKWWGRAKEALKYCDGEYDILEYARVLEFHARLAPDYDVSVNGSGGEFAKGYWWELLYPRVGAPRHFDPRLVAAKRFAVQPVEPGLLREEVPGGLVDHFAEIIRRENQGLESHPNTAQMDNVYLSLRMQRWHGRIASSTIHIWPCVSPFMFRRPLEIALASPPKARLRNRMSSDLLEHLDPRLAAMPLAEGYPATRLRFGNAHRFLPMYSGLAAKVWQRAAGKLGLGRPTPVAPDPSFVRILESEEVQDHFDPERMLTSELYEPQGLSARLVRLGEAPTEPMAGRMLTLERLAREIREARQAMA